MRPTCLAGLLAVVCAASAPAQDDDELRPGLLAKYLTGTAEQQRIDDAIAFAWDDASPDPLLPTGPFTAQWTGQLLVRDEFTYRFHAYVAGAVRVELDGRTVLNGRHDSPAWVSGPDTPLDFGFKSLQVTYERTGARGGLHVYWASDRFPLEPVPGSILFLPDGDAAATFQNEFDLRERGRVLFAAYRCAACHQDAAPLPSAPAPSLAHIGAGTDGAWLLAKLQSRHRGAEHSLMPNFGFDDREARAVLAYLTSVSQPLELPPVPVVERDPKRDPPDGRVLLHSLGCLACHRVGELGSDAPFGGGDLSDIGARRAREWLYAQLSEPSKINAHARMPVFDLSAAERVALVETLAGTGAEPAARQEPRPPEQDAALVERGRHLFESARCAACHGSPDGTDVRPFTRLFIGRIPEWERSCLSDAPNRTPYRPHFPQTDREALKTYVSAVIGRGGKVSPPGSAARGELILEQKNCLGCHERGNARGIVPIAGRLATEFPEFSGQSQTLIPPNLTAVGDKLLDEPLAKSVRGEQPRRMPWLRLRMPKFTHNDAEQAALVAHFIDTDRIPPAAPDSRTIPAADTADAQTLLAGRTLAGPHGFSCIACHECGKYVPPNVSIATHGSDLLGFAQRMRPEFFLRWTRSPLRVVPGIEMPSYERPAPGLLDGHADTQLAALWHALRDPDFSMPTNPAAVEQLLVVRPGTRTVVLRDVFSVSEACGGGYVPRALALGFANGHSVLFDLDNARVREWTLGEFARQRTQGKSWYWDMAGAPLLKSKQSGYGLWLELPGNDPTLIEPSVPNPEPRGLSPWPAADVRPIRLKSYRQADNSVHVEYAVTFATDGGPVEVHVHETWRPDNRSASAGFQRDIHVAGLKAGRLLCAIPEPDAIEDAIIASTVAGVVEPVSISHGLRAVALQPADQSDEHRVTLSYSSRLQPPQLPPLEIADPPAAADPVTTAPGFTGRRLPIKTSIMPTAMAWRPDGALVFTSLKGHVYLVRDTDGDGVEDALSVFEEGLAAPFGVLPDGDDLLVAHKPELLRLRDTDGDGRCDERIVVADGWGYTHDYHDWTAGPVRDSGGNLFLAISSDYQQSKRDRSTIQWRGNVLRLDPDGAITPIARELRFPMGIALDAHGRLFVSDQQGVQNCFNEINHIVEGGRYGVPALADPPGSADHTRASVQIPHPWTRSVNGILFLPTGGRQGGTAGLSSSASAAGGRGWTERSEGSPGARATPLNAFAGHGLGCEYNGRFLVRFTLQEVQGALQGAVYEFTSPTWEQDSDAFLGPICAAMRPDGALYVGSIFDSGWLGGRNTGEIVQLLPQGEVPNGIREVRAVPGGFEIEFIRPVAPALAADPANYAINGYTRVWQGSYATPDSDLHSPKIASAEVSADARTVTLRIDDLRAGHVYEFTCRTLTTDGTPLRPSAAHYSMNRLP